MNIRDVSFDILPLSDPSVREWEEEVVEEGLEDRRLFVNIKNHRFIVLSALQADVFCFFRSCLSFMLHTRSERSLNSFGWGP